MLFSQIKNSRVIDPARHHQTLQWRAFSKGGDKMAGTVKR
jgi:hypothetical protein